MVFGLFKKAGADALNKYSGNKDFLEAVCAASAIVAAADGTVSDDEVEACVNMARENETLRTVYKQSEIEECIERQLKRAKSASGRAGLNRELDDVAAKPIDLREDVYLAALDVASADGDIGAKEQQALNQIAQRLSVDSKKFA